MLQAKSYVLSHAGSVNPSNTFIIFLSANDYVNTVIGQNNATVAGVVEAIKETLDILRTAGATQ